MSPFLLLRKAPEGQRLIAFSLSLLALLLLYPLMVALDAARFFRFVFVLFLVNAVYTLSGDKRQFRWALVLGLPALLAQLSVYSLPNQAFLVASTVLTIPFLVLVIKVIFAAVLAPGEIWTDKLAGAISVYLLLGLLWAFLYALAALLAPDAFAVRGAVTLDQYLRSGAEYTFIYYSFVTLTTLGYGDITPTHLFSQTLAWLEAVTGQLFLAITIASLVGARIAHSGKRT